MILINNLIYIAFFTLPDLVRFICVIFIRFQAVDVFRVTNLQGAGGGTLSQSILGETASGAVIEKFALMNSKAVTQGKTGPEGQQICKSTVFESK